MRGMAKAIPASLALLACVSAHLHEHPAARHLQALTGNPKADPVAGGGPSCGNGLPEFDGVTNREPEVVPQEYGLEASGSGASRRLVGFSPISEANAEPIRIKVLTHQLDGEATGNVPSMCESASEVATVSGAAGGSQPWQCTAAAVPTGARLTQLKRSITWSVERISRAFHVQPAQSAIELSNSIKAEFLVPESMASVADTDLVIILVAWPSPFRPVAGYASCRQTDQYGRCTVGFVNIVPELVDVEGANLPSTIINERRTSLHELTHVLGGIIPGTPHVADDGSRRPNSDVWTYSQAVHMSETSAATDPKRVAIFMRTPRVLRMAREHYNCSSLPGVPLEDLPLGMGAHWEARVMGPEYMSYGMSSGDAYVSDLTVAMLEDTGHYLVPDYSKFTGTLYQESAALVTTDVTLTSGYTPPPFTPGALRWGRSGGCGFVLGDPRKEWDPALFCLKANQLGCTPDNRMSAICVLRSGAGVDTQYSCGFRHEDGGCSAGPTQSAGCDSGGQNCALPVEQQHFTAAEISDAFSGSSAQGATTVDRVGGHSAAMDFVPVRVGYWSCLSSWPSVNDSGRSVADPGSDTEVSQEVKEAASAATDFGGQSYCRECRCFASSLYEVTKGVPPLGGPHGLCYAHNCYRSDYLQVAVKGVQGNIAWFRCPPDGGKIFVPGFLGRLTCPPAKEFCATEAITGVKHAESTINSTVYGVIALGCLAVLLLLICLLPCTRNCINNCCRRRLQTDTYEPQTWDSHERSWYKERRLPTLWKSMCVLLSNSVTLTWGLFVTILAAVVVSRGLLLKEALPFLAVGAVVSFLAVLGSCGVRQSTFGTSSCTFVFIYASFLTAAGFAVFAASLALDDASLRLTVRSSFDIAVDALPARAVDRSAPTETQIDQAVAFLKESFFPIAVAVCLGISLLLLASMCAACTVRRATLAMVTYNLVYQVAYLVAVVAIAIGAVLVATSNSLPDVSSVEGLTQPGTVFFIIGAFLLVFSIVASCSARGPRRLCCCTSFTILMSGAIMVAAAAGTVLAVMFRQDAAGTLSKLNEAQISLLQLFLGGGLTEAELELAIQAQILALGLGSAALAFVAFANVVSGCVLLRARLPSFDPPTIPMAGAKPDAASNP
ncbi:hypothetical protein FNF27_05929 [Cafeteria roenbergensis]|uniref:Leishmanolysin-like peptidase n=4 Tax=Cafeteria roenbergensis TaxID=33653 RepID=A0A5A8E469_CAFRO|nr:hypothetical protein FNF27_05929 [Cafeteria roenbergensis]